MSLSTKGYPSADTDRWRHTFKFSALAGQVNIFSRKFSQNVLIQGGKYLIGTQADSQGRDYIEIAFVDVDGILYPPGTVLKTFITEEYVNPGEIDELIDETVAFLPAGIYIQATYASFGTLAVDWRLRLMMRR